MTDDQRPDLEWPSEDLARPGKQPEPRPEVEWPSEDVTRAAGPTPPAPAPEPAPPAPAPQPPAPAPEPPAPAPEPTPPAPAPQPPTPAPEPPSPAPAPQPPAPDPWADPAAGTPTPDPWADPAVEAPAYQPPPTSDPWAAPEPVVPAYQPPVEPQPEVPAYQPPPVPEDPYEIPPTAPGLDVGYSPPPEYRQLPGENPYATSSNYGDATYAEQPYGHYSPPPPAEEPADSGPYAVSGMTGLVGGRETEDTTSGERKYFRRDIEGLRAVAVIAVVLFHVGLPFFEGGFVGVDVFYVISGFLITGLLLREGEASGKVDLVRFYARRMRRLLPAALLVIVVTLVASAFIVTPLRLAEIAGDAAASALYVANFRFALDATNYLAVEAPSPLLHYWSLGVEEQFYLVWPLILLVVMRFLPKRLVGVSVLLLAIVSFGLSLVWTSTSPEWAFFSPFTRAWELAAGALIAIGLLRIPGRVHRIGGSISVVLGLLLIAVSVFMAQVLSELDLGQNEIVNAIFPSPESPYPGVAALLPVLGAVLVIMGGSHSRTLVGRFVLGNPVSRYFGRISYSLYLWHWPILVLIPIELGVDDLGTRLLLAGVAVVIAALSTELWERPFRRSDLLDRRNAGSVRMGLAGSVAVGVTALLMSGAITLPSVIELPWIQPPREVTELAGVRSDLPRHYDDDCHLLGYRQQRLKTECVYGDPDGDRTAVLVGDSHAAQWMPALDAYAAQKGWRLEVLTKAACPVIDVPVWERSQRSTFDQCINWRGKVSKHIRETEPDVVYVGLSRDYELWDGRVIQSREATTYWREKLSEYLATTGKQAGEVVLLAETPFLPYDPVDCLADVDIPTCDPPTSIVVDAGYAALEQQAATDAGAKLLSANELLCPDASCPVVADGIVVFRDNHHVTATYMEHLVEPIGNLLEGRPAYPTPSPTMPSDAAVASEDSSQEADGS